MKVSFIDVKTQNKLIRKKAIKAFTNVFDSGDFILGKEVSLFEKDFSKFCGSKYAVGVNSGTDALSLGLLSLGIKPKDEVICPVYTYIATALSISYIGAKPVFVDIDKTTFNIDVKEIEKRITKRTKAIIAVHLYGNPAAMLEIRRIAKKHNLKVIEDAAQAQGAKIKVGKNKWKDVGSFGDIGCFSFYPTKNLSGCGDAGIVVTDNKKTYQNLLMLRDQGRKGSNRYMHYIIGYNSRLDSIQAALLRQKLKYLNKNNDVRIKMAKEYTKNLKSIEGLKIPIMKSDHKNVFHIYPVLLKQRDLLSKSLAKFNISTGIVYHSPLHIQPAYRHLGYKKGDFPNAEYVSKSILCLPMHASLNVKQVKYATNKIKKILEE